MSSESLPEGPEVLPPPPPADGPYVVSFAYINVRSGPGTEYPAYGVAPPGASVELLGASQDGDWWQIKVPTTVSPDGVTKISRGTISSIVLMGGEAGATSKFLS